MDREERGDRAVILHPVFDSRVSEAALSEFTELARSAGVEVLAVLQAPRKRADAAYMVGKGKVDELAQKIDETGADLVLVSQALSASQERNLEKKVECRVLDRTTLILDIFAQRARTFEGKLQVELAQLRHLSTRLVRGWTHLERQKGGIGLRGPGETQLETDRQLLGARLRQLKSRLDKVERQRDTSRQSRLRSRYPLVALVGYTNAGKSTLFNNLTKSDVIAEDKLFATLDPTVRRLDGLGCGPLLLADTVGFVSDLPHDLVSAFRSTLQETRDADLLLHIIDAADPEHSQREDEVVEVLESIGAETVPVLRIYNKNDLTEFPAGLLGSEEDPRGIRVSALDGSGLDVLKEVLDRRFSSDRIIGWIDIPPQAARLRARLFQMEAVEEEHLTDSGGWKVRVNLPTNEVNQLASIGGLEGRLVRSQLIDKSESIPEPWEKAASDDV